jgi:hypothetical protein
MKQKKQTYLVCFIIEGRQGPDPSPSPLQRGAGGGKTKNRLLVQAVPIKSLALLLSSSGAAPDFCPNHVTPVAKDDNKRNNDDDNNGRER